VVRCAYALRPEGIVFPLDEATGKVSLRLEKLSVANGLMHEAAHDALSDVRATIALAKLLKTAQPRLFDFALKMRLKTNVQDEIGYPYDFKKTPKPFLHISGMFGVERRYLAVVFPLAIHPVNKNELIVWDLASDPADLIGLSVDEIRQRMFTSTDELGVQGLARLPIKTIHINKSPIVISQLKTLNDVQSQACGVDWDVVEQHESNAQTHLNTLKKIDWQAVFEREFDDSGRSVEETLYGGAFVSDADYRIAEQAMDAQRRPTGKIPNFKDSRLSELWWHYRARHFPETLSVDEQAQWHDEQAQHFIGDGEQTGFDAWLTRLNELGAQYADQPDKIAILQAVHTYGQSLMDGLEE
jgi:exodeoxyribonuclease-1